MKIITLDTLKNMPNGTVFCEVDKWGNFERDIRVLTGKFDNESRFNGEIGLYPFIEEEYGQASMFDENSVLIKDKNFATGWYTTDTSDIDYEKDQLFAIFTKREVEKMIEMLQWALSGFETDFDMDEVIKGD